MWKRNEDFLPLGFLKGRNKREENYSPGWKNNFLLKGTFWVPSLEISSQKLYNIITRILGSIPVYMNLPAASFLNCSGLEGQVHMLCSLFSTYVSHRFTPAAVAQCPEQSGTWINVYWIWLLTSHVCILAVSQKPCLQCRVKVGFHLYQFRFIFNFT